MRCECRLAQPGEGARDVSKCFGETCVEDAEHPDVATAQLGPDLRLAAQHDHLVAEALLCRGELVLTARGVLGHPEEAYLARGNRLARRIRPQAELPRPPGAAEKPVQARAERGLEERGERLRSQPDLTAQGT
ncbi:MAG: hypothetical protein AAF447_12650 [Myxococcota bacterium]